MAAAALAAAMMLAACRGDDGGSVFAATDVEQGLSADDARVGRPVHVGLAGFEVTGRETVHVENVEVLDVPDGLRVQAVHAVPVGGGGTIGVYDGDLAKAPVTPQLRPVTEASFVPGERQQWYFLVSVVANRPGTYKTGGIELRWRAGDRRGRQTFRYYITVSVPSGRP